MSLEASTPGSERALRLAFLYTHPIQYCAPLMRTLAQQPGVDLTVFYCSRQGLDQSFDPEFGVSFQWDIPLLEGYKSIFLPNLRGERGVGGFFSLVNPAVVRELWNRKFDAILVHGYEHCSKWLAFAGARVAGTKILLRGESQLLNQRPLHIRAAKRILLGGLFRKIAAFACIGRENSDFYRHYGVPEERLFFAPYVVDNETFRDQDRALRPDRESLRTALGVTRETPIIVACGKLIEKKEPLLMLRAFQQLRGERPCALVFVGEGALRSEIERIVREEQIPDVTITGFLNQSEIARAYVAADILALPSSFEPWGLVVNEAMNFGLPIVASNRVGCSADLVRPGENGFIVEYGQVGALVEALRTLIVDPALRNSYGQRSREIVAEYSLEACATAIAERVRATARPQAVGR